jgi:hypothetical protein
MRTSDNIIEIAKALAKFNEEVKAVSKDANNPFFKNQYATLDNILDAIRPILAKNGLSTMFLPSSYEDGHFGIKVLLLHSTGEFIEGDEVRMKPVKPDPQMLGSLWTYLKRYSISAVLGLSVGDPDDDGNAATHGTNDPEKFKQQQQAPQKSGTPSEAQIKRLFGIAYGKGIKKDNVEAYIKKALNKSVSELTISEYETVCKGFEAMQQQ